jgi:hypothetical protein
MKFYEHYQNLVTHKKAALLDVVKEARDQTTPGPPEVLSVAFDELVEGGQAWDKIYEYYQCRQNFKRGKPTKVVETGQGGQYGRAFVIYSEVTPSELEPQSQLKSKSTLKKFALKLTSKLRSKSQSKSSEYDASEPSQIKALSYLKAGFKFIDLYGSGDEDRKKMHKRQLFRQFKAACKLMDESDGQESLPEVLGSYISAVQKVLDSGSSKKGPFVKETLGTLRLWAQTDFAPHDFVTIKRKSDSFTVTGNISSPNLILCVDMAVIACLAKNKESQEEMLAFLQEKLGEGFNEIEMKVRLKLAEKPPGWYRELSTERQTLVQSYAAHYIKANLFMSTPVKLDGHETFMPQGSRGCHLLSVGKLMSGDDLPYCLVDTMRKGAPSRTTNVEENTKASVENIKLARAAAKGLEPEKAITIVEVSLNTDAITSLSAIKGKSHTEPDRAILQAQDVVAKANEDVVHRQTGIIAKDLTSTTLRENRDPRNLLKVFIEMTLNANQGIFSNPQYGQDLQRAYDIVQHLTLDLKQSDAFIRQVDEVEELLGKLKQVSRALPQAQVNERKKLEKHIMLLEAICTYRVVETNHAKKRSATKTHLGKYLDPVIKTAIEQERYDESDFPLEDNMYDQWLLALENIIGSNFDVLEDVSSSEQEFVKTIYEFYCKDGRDRTGLTAMLFELINTNFAESLNKDYEGPGLSMVAVETKGQNLQINTDNFLKNWKDIVEEGVSQALCGSPGSSMGEYGLLEALFGKSIIACAVPSCLRAIAHEVATRAAQQFNAEPPENAKILLQFISEAAMVQGDIGNALDETDFCVDSLGAQHIEATFKASSSSSQ